MIGQRLDHLVDCPIAAGRYDKPHSGRNAFLREASGAPRAIGQADLSRKSALDEPIGRLFELIEPSLAVQAARDWIDDDACLGGNHILSAAHRKPAGGCNKVERGPWAGEAA